MNPSQVHYDGSRLFGEEDVVRLEVPVREGIGSRSVHVRHALANLEELRPTVSIELSHLAH